MKVNVFHIQFDRSGGELVPLQEYECVDFWEGFLKWSKEDMGEEWEGKSVEEWLDWEGFEDVDEWKEQEEEWVDEGDVDGIRYFLYDGEEKVVLMVEGGRKEVGRVLGELVVSDKLHLF
jgi:hypothetical protein